MCDALETHGNIWDMRVGWKKVLASHWFAVAVNQCWLLHKTLLACAEERNILMPFPQVQGIVMSDTIHCYVLVYWIWRLLLFIFRLNHLLQLLFACFVSKVSIKPQLHDYPHIISPFYRLASLVLYSSQLNRIPSSKSTFASYPRILFAFSPLAYLTAQASFTLPLLRVGSFDPVNHVATSANKPATQAKFSGIVTS